MHYPRLFQYFLLVYYVSTLVENFTSFSMLVCLLDFAGSSLENKLLSEYMHVQLYGIFVSL